MSNINNRRLEVWQGASGAFDGAGIVVGSQPWGMTFSRTAAAKDTLYVANSGGTNLSRGFVGGGAEPSMKGDLTTRLPAPPPPMFRLTAPPDPPTRKIRLTPPPPII